jgi:hypothetical protein
LPAERRNILRPVFGSSRIRAAQEDWTAWRGCWWARSGRTWRDNDVRVFGESIKRLRHATLGPIELEYSSFAVEGRPDLGLIVYNPVRRADADRIRALVSVRDERQTNFG